VWTCPLIPRGRWCRLACAIVFAIGAWATPARAVTTDPCGALASEVERSEGIPPGLVHAVALAESGRWSEHDRTSRPWPWTVTASTDSWYLPSKAAALAKVRELQAAGRTNIDVGCMQVNLGYHGHAFRTLEEALDPVRNVTYGARFLKRLRLETRSWAGATARYHSSDPDRGDAYRAKVYRLWRELRGGGGDRPQVVRIVPRPLSGDPEGAAGDPAVRGRLWSPHGSEPADPRIRADDVAPGAIAILRGR
jgi:hypothetical protein